MAWDELPVGARAGGGTQTEFTLAVGKNGNIRISVPKGHPLETAARIKTLIGKGEDAGWIRLVAVGEGEKGRKLHSAFKTDRKQIIYSSLPKAPKQLPAEVVEWENGDTAMMVAIKLPWAAAFAAPAPGPSFRAPAAPVEGRPGVRTVPVPGDRSTDKPFSMMGRK